VEQLGNAVFEAKADRMPLYLRGSFGLVFFGDCGHTALSTKQIDIPDAAVLADHIESLRQMVNHGCIVRSTTAGFRQARNGSRPQFGHFKHPLKRLDIVSFPFCGVGRLPKILL